MRKSLGKGISALIPDAKGPQRRGVLNIPLSQIETNPNQPRKDIGIKEQKELIASIQEKGIIQPILVREKGSGKFEIIAGERRYRAAKSLGLYTIPAIVKEVTKNETLEIALIENIQRKNLTPLEEARAYKQLIEEYKLTHTDISKRVGKDRATITNFLRILKLPKEITNSIGKREISMGHAIALLSNDNPEIQKRIHTKIIKENLSVRETEKLVGNYKVRKKYVKIVDVHIKQLEDRLSKKFGTRVVMKQQGKKGKIIIEYYSLDDLDRILDTIG